jgi:hypothetical protein
MKLDMMLLLHAWLVLADFDQIELNGRTVLWPNDPLASAATHSEARSRCQREGGDLFSPYTAEENQWLVDQSTGLVPLPGKDNVGLWIGLGPHDGMSSNNSESFAWYRTGQTPGPSNGYPRTAWVQGEPNGGNGKGGPQQGVCVQAVVKAPPHYNPDWPAAVGAWDDDTCTEIKSFACEVWK